MRYCGEYADDETGLLYLRARYYDPSIGRFISEDPAEDGTNWYIYCGDNPVMFVDPSGRIMEGDEKFKQENPIVYNALLDLTATWEQLDGIEKNGIHIGDMKKEVAQLATVVRVIGDGMFVKESTGVIDEQLNNTEEVLYAKYPNEGFTYLTDRANARARTEKRYGDGYRTDDESDAYRHSYFGAELACRIGIKAAKLFQDAHEYGWPTNICNGFWGTKMDLHTTK